MTRAIAAALVGLLLVLGLALWHHPRPVGDARPVVVGSKKFPESQLLADMLVELLRSRGIPVQARNGLGGTRIAFSALETGAVDVYVEYTGTGQQEILKAPPGGTAQEVYEKVRDEFRKRWGLEWLDPIGFENTYAIALRAATAREHGITTLSQLVPVARGLTFGPTHEFLKRDDCYPGLRRVYGLEFARAEPMEHGLAYKALLDDKVDAIDVYSTDGNLDTRALVVLQDDKHAFPPYMAAPVVRGDTLQRVSGLRDALNALAGRIDDKTMQALNHRVESERQPSEAVAHDFLVQQGLVGGTQGAAAESRRLIPYLWNHRADLARLTGQHLYLTGVSMALAVVVGIPLGILISRVTRLAPPVLGFTGILQTVPSLALLAFMIPYLGLGETPAIAALFLYGLLPVVRNTHTGLRAVDPALLEVADGMGLTRSQRLWLVEVPLASAVIMAGVRTAVVIAIGTATLAAFIGAGGLGNPIVTGLTLNDDVVILSGAIPAALLAIVVDLLLGGLERVVVPRGLRRG